MPRSFLLTNRRYIPTPPPTDAVNDNDDNNNNNNNQKASQSTISNDDMDNVSRERWQPVVTPSNNLSSEMIVAHILIGQAEQTEAVNLAIHKPTSDDTTTATVTTTTTTTNNNNSQLIISKDSFEVCDNSFDRGCCGNDQAVFRKAEDSASDGSFYNIYDDSPRPTVIYTVSNNSNNYSKGYSNNYINTMDAGSSNNNGDVGMDLSLKAEQRSPPPPLPPPTSLPQPDSPDKSSLSDGDSDSGCSSQNEARSHLPPEVEYGWAECHAHFSLLYDLMTQGGRKLPGKEVEQTSKETTEPAPYDYSQTPTRDVVQEPPVLYELMTESPRKASGRDVPDHAMEVEVSMQQYPHPQSQSHQQQQQYQQPQHQSALHQQPPQQPYQRQHQTPPPPPPPPARPQYDDHRRATLQEVAHDRGHVQVSVPGPRYEPRRSLNDLLFAAGLPPVSPPSPAPISPSVSPMAGEEIHACEECGKRYSTSSNLARHRQTHRSHGDKKARKCPHCDKVYVSMPAFSMHVRTHNQGCACPHCGKRFSRPWLLQGHIRTHTGEKPFACPQCGKSFADKSNLRAHIQTHSSEKPYVCGRCGKAFALKSYLYKHEESSCMRGERFRPLRRHVSAEC